MIKSVEFVRRLNGWEYTLNESHGQPEVRVHEDSSGPVTLTLFASDPERMKTFTLTLREEKQDEVPF